MHKILADKTQAGAQERSDFSSDEQPVMAVF